MKKLYFFNLIFLLVPFISAAQTQGDYSSNAVLSKRVKILTDHYLQLVKSKALTQTSGGKTIWILTIGTASKTN